MIANSERCAHCKRKYKPGSEAVWVSWGSVHDSYWIARYHRKPYRSAREIELLIPVCTICAPLIASEYGKK